jgi:hypothetical protein
MSRCGIISGRAAVIRFQRGDWPSRSGFAIDRAVMPARLLVVDRHSVCRSGIRMLIDGKQVQDQFMVLVGRQPRSGYIPKPRGAERSLGHRKE